MKIIFLSDLNQILTVLFKIIYSLIDCMTRVLLTCHFNIALIGPLTANVSCVDISDVCIMSYMFFYHSFSDFSANLMIHGLVSL